MPNSAASDDLSDRIVDAALRCVARYGVAKTTLEDVAREAGCGRATIYRTFQGGKTELLLAVLRREVVRGEATIEASIAEATDLESLLVNGVLAAARLLRGHEALGFLLAHEPDVVLPMMSFDRLDALIRHATAFAAPHLARFVGEPDAQRAAEWVVRIALSYSLNPSDHIDPTDEHDVRRLVVTYLLPAVVPATTRS